MGKICRDVVCMPIALVASMAAKVRQVDVLKFSTTSPSPGEAIKRLMSYLVKVQLFLTHKVHISEIINFTTLGCCHPAETQRAPIISIH